MLKNLEAELTRKGISKKYLVEYLGVSPKTVQNKISGKSDFTWPEVQKISALFPEHDLNYLFEIFPESA